MWPTVTRQTTESKRKYYFNDPRVFVKQKRKKRCSELKRKGGGARKKRVTFVGKQP